MALTPGHTLLNGQYRIVRLLGRGGFGFVYLAHDGILGEEVAVKELIPALVGDEIILKRFLAEAKATMRLAHDRIVRTHNIFVEGGNYYIAMEYMPGGSLEERLRDGQCLAVDEAVHIAVQVAEGLAYAHERGVVHCDLKPANILFAADGAAKVADFGIAHVSDQMLSRSWMTPAGFVAGTLPYMSPEQTDGVRDDPRVDVYALGAVLYRMLTGRTYIDFDQRDTPRATAENVQRICGQQPLPPSAAAPRQHIPAWLDAVVLKALAKRPEDRYTSADVMRAALLRRETVAAAGPPKAVATAPAKAPPARRPTVMPGAPARPVRQPMAEKQRRTLIASLAGVAGVLLLALVIGLAVVLGGGEQPTPTSPLAAGVAQTATRALEPTRLLPPSTTDTPLPPTGLPSGNATVGTRTPLPPMDTPLTASTPSRPSATRIRPTAPPRPLDAGATQTRAEDGAVMVYVPAGEFLMGSTDAEINALLTQCSHCKREYFVDELPQHTVYLDAFWIDRTEVTNAQYRKCVEAGTCRAPTACDWGDPTYGDASKADHPVVCVSWDDARTYCEWAGARLPTEAEWEKAARGSDGRLYPWGNTFDGSALNFCDRNCEFVWKDTNAEDGYARTAPVGSYPSGASPYGALDMAGNVWEWVNDWYDENYYSRSPDRNPTGPDSGENRALHGGSWGDYWYHARAAHRHGHGVDPTFRSSYVGFRCGADAPGG